jgi:FKBP-type peptidyl-prolyl cis-trans isomerase SlyD
MAKNRVASELFKYAGFKEIQFIEKVTAEPEAEVSAEPEVKAEAESKPEAEPEESSEPEV